MRFSHREYASRGATASVWRCRACGMTARDEARVREDTPVARRASRRPPVDEGPPANPVIDPDVARRLLGEAGSET